MATRKSVDARRKVAGKILHIRNVEGIPASTIKREGGDGAYVRMEDFQELLTDAKKLAGSILSSKEPKHGLLDRVFGRSH